MSAGRWNEVFSVLCEKGMRFFDSIEVRLQYVQSELANVSVHHDNEI